MEVIALIMSLADRSPDFVVGFVIGMLIAAFVLYVYLLPKLVRRATEGLTLQVTSLVKHVETQSEQITHLKEQVGKLETELAPYRQFAEQQMARIFAAQTAISLDGVPGTSGTTVG